MLGGVQNTGAWQSWQTDRHFAKT